MKTLSVNRKIIVSILTMALLIYGLQGISYGQVSISEIMYGSEIRFSPKQWIEISNTGTEPINLTGWTLTIQNVDSDDLLGPVTATINFRDATFEDAPRIWPNDFLLIVTSATDDNSGGFIEDQVYDLRWREDLGISFNTTWLSVEGFRITITDKDGNLVDEVGNYDGVTTLWDLPYSFNRGRTREGNRTSLIRCYVEGVALDGSQEDGWASAVDANLTAEQLTYYGDENDISSPGIGIINNPKTFALISGSDQQDAPGTTLASPFVVEVRDQCNKPLPEVQVTFSVTSGGGVVSATSVMTDNNGRVESTLTLGPNLGANAVTVSVTRIQEQQTFNAEGIRIPKAFEIISGNDQQGAPGTALASLFVVEVRDQYDTPLPDVEVTFSVTGGGGVLSGTSVMTDNNGQARSTLTLGPNLGANTVTVSVTRILEQQIFNAEGIRIPKTFEIISGDDQEAVSETALPNPFVVEVRDQYDDPLPDVEVTFSVTSGGGALSATSVLTDDNGRTESTLTLGPDPGTNIVEVTVTGIQPKLTVEAIAESPPIPQDVNGDDVVNILDLVFVASALGDEGQGLVADVNADGVVNILDLVSVAGALGDVAAAPSSDPRALAMLTAADVGEWLAQVEELGLMDATAKRGVLFLEQLLAVLTPKETVLLPNYPNPFNPETWIPYRLAEDSNVTLTIYDTNGVVVRRLDLGRQLAGHYADRGRAAYWDGRNARGESVASGVYFYQLATPSFRQIRRMVILK